MTSTAVVAAEAANAVSAIEIEGGHSIFFLESDVDLQRLCCDG